MVWVHPQRPLKKKIPPPPDVSLWFLTSHLCVRFSSRNESSGLGCHSTNAISDELVLFCATIQRNGHTGRRAQRAHRQQRFHSVRQSILQRWSGRQCFADRWLLSSPQSDAGKSYKAKSLNWNRGDPMASRRGQILLANFYPICVLPMRLATVSTEIPFRLRDFALYTLSARHSNFTKILTNFSKLIATQKLTTKSEITTQQTRHLH